MYRSFLCFAALLITPPFVLAAEDLETAYQSLEEAESKKDVAQMKKLAVEVCALAQKVIVTPAPENDAEKEAWTKRIAYAREVSSHAEYALYGLALQGPPAATIELLSTIEQFNPKSRYLDEGYSQYFLALNQTGAAAKIVPIAEKALANLPENEDLLLVLADAAVNQKQYDRALNYAERLVAALGKHPKPEGISPADWARKRNAALGRGHFIAGLMHFQKTQYYEADKDLRAALPLNQGNETTTATTLFHLGVANYQLGSMTRNKALMLEAAKFSDQAAAIKGPLSVQAWRNAQLMRAEAAKMR